MQEGLVSFMNFSPSKRVYFKNCDTLWGTHRKHKGQLRVRCSDVIINHAFFQMLIFLFSMAYLSLIHI